MTPSPRRARSTTSATPSVTSRIGNLTARGLSAVILSTCVGISYAVALISASLRPESVTDVTGNLLTTLGGVLVGGVIGWLGGRQGTDDADHRVGGDTPH